MKKLVLGLKVTNKPGTAKVGGPAHLFDGSERCKGTIV